MPNIKNVLRSNYFIKPKVMVYFNILKIMKGEFCWNLKENIFVTTGRNGTFPLITSFSIFCWLLFFCTGASAFRNKLHPDNLYSGYSSKKQKINTY